MAGSGLLARLFVLIGGLIVLALTAALVGPYFIDWTTYRSDFEREASAILGRKVTVEGEARARLLPFPSVSFSNVRVAGLSPDDPAVTVESFSMDAELAPFLRGEVLIFDMRLVKPRATITVAEDGQVDWVVQPSAPFDARNIALENLTVVDGEVDIRHAAGGRSHQLSDIYADVSARSLAGPWRLVGSLAVDGVKTRVAASTGTAENGRMRLRVEANPADYPFVLQTDGDARIEDGAVIYGGRFQLNSRTAVEEAELRGGDGESFALDGAEAPPPYRVSGQFSFDHELIGIDEFRLESGPVEDPYIAEGTAFIDLGPDPRFAIRADGAQVRFDETAEEGAGGDGATPADRIGALKRVLAALPNPDMPGTVDVNLPAIVAGDTTIRSVRLSAEPAEDGWRLNALSAVLPGRTTLEADGFLATGEDFGFSGSLLLAVGQPSGFAAWLSRDVNDAIRRLPAAGFSAEVEIGERRQSFRELELILGAAKFEGEVVNVQPEGARPSMTLRLDGGELDLDGLTAFASLFVSEDGENRFTDHDLDFEITAGPVHAAGISAETLDTALRLKEGRLEIDRLSIGGLAGASVSATGTLKDFQDDPSGNLDASLVAVDLEPLVSVLAERYPGNPVAAALKERAEDFPGFFEDATLDLVASAAPNGAGGAGLAVSAHGAAAGTGFSITASASGTTVDWREADLTLDLSAQNQDAAALMALYALPALPLGMTGPGDTSLTMKGSLAEGLATEAHFGGEDIEAFFDGVVEEGAEGLAATGNASLRTGDLEPWLMTAGVALPGMGLGLPVEMRSSVTLAEGALALSDLSGTVAGGAVEGDLTAELKAGVPHVRGALALDTLDLGLAAAMVLGEPPLQGDSGGWPETPFNSTVSPAFTAAVDLTAKSLLAGPAVEASDASLKAQLDAGSLRVSDLKAAFRGGAAEGLFELTNNGGTGLLSAQLRLDDVDLAQALPGGALTGAGSLAASLTANGKSLSGMVASLAGSGTASASGLVISGLNPQAFAPILAHADEIGRDIDAPQTAAFAPEIAGSGSFHAGDAELAFTVAGGVLRAPPLTLEGEEAGVTADIRADLAAGTVQVTGEIAYEPGVEALVGSSPAVGFVVQGPVDNPTLRFNTEPLAQFLTQRALEREQARVEAMQAALLEQQRLRRETRYYAALQEERERLEAQRLLVEQEERRRAEAQARLEAEEEARLQAEAEARRAEEEARRIAEEEARLAEEEARQEAEEQARRAAEEQRRLQAEEAARQEEEAARQAEQERPVLDAPLVERRPLPEEPQPQAPARDEADGLPGVGDPFRALTVDGFLRSLE